MAEDVAEKSEVKTDPELLRQLGAARGDSKPIVGIFRLKPEDSTQLTNSPERTAELVNEVFGRVEEKTGVAPQRYNILRNMGVVIVYAQPAFLSEFLTQPEVASAMASGSPGGGKIEPINKRPVPAESINKRADVKSSGGSKSVSGRAKGASSARSRGASGRKSSKK